MMLDGRKIGEMNKWRRGKKQVSKPFYSDYDKRSTTLMPDFSNSFYTFLLLQMFKDIERQYLHIIIKKVNITDSSLLLSQKTDLYSYKFAISKKKPSLDGNFLANNQILKLCIPQSIYEHYMQSQLFNKECPQTNPETRYSPHSHSSKIMASISQSNHASE